MMLRIGGWEDMNVISKLRNGKNLSDPYELSIEKNPKKGVEDDLDYETTLESDKDPNGISSSPKDSYHSSPSRVP